MPAGPADPTLRLSEQRIIATLRGHPGLSRAAISQRTALPRTTVVAAVAALLRRGLLIEHDEPPNGARPVGRPATVLSLAPPPGPVAVIAFAHSSTTIALCDYAGTVLARRTPDIALDAAFDTVLAALHAELDTLTATTGGPAAARAVIGVPMPYERGRGARHPRRPSPAVLTHYPNLQPIPDWLLSDPTAAFTDGLGIPTIVENDANLGALGEARNGAGRDYRAVLYLTLHDGIGAGLVLDGNLYHGATGVAGELAHIRVQDNGRLCACGNRGCLATVHKTSPLLTEEIGFAYGHPISLTDLDTLAEHGDAGVLRILTDMGRVIGRPLADLVAFLNPDAIVIDNTLGAATQAVGRGIRDLIDERTSPMIRDAITVVPGQLGDTAQLHGASALAQQQHANALLGIAAH